MIRFNTFLKKGLPKIDDRYGCYFVCGRQGSGKTYFAIYLATRQDLKQCNYIKTNVHSLKLDGAKIEYFEKIDELYQDTDEKVIYIILLTFLG